MNINGKIVLVKIGFEHEMLSILTDDGVVSPIMDYFLKIIYKISDPDKRYLYFKNKKTLSVIYGGVEESIELKSIEFSVDGWEVNDIEAMESGSGVNIYDSITNDTKIKNMLLAYLNKDVELIIKLQ